MFKKIILITVFFLVLSGCQIKSPFYKESRFLLGTVVEVSSPYPEAIPIAFKEIERVENIFSIYKPDSVVSHLNKTGFLNTNFEVTYLIEKAMKFSQLTGGLYDISIGELSLLWKKAIAKGVLPGEKEIKDAVRKIGFRNISVDRKNNNIKFMVKGLSLDFGSIAKGYAVDAAIKELKRKGIDSAIVRAGGDIYCLGTKPGGLWKIGIRDPRKIGRTTGQVLELKDEAVSTSGDYEQYLQVGKERYSHIISPKTGYPVNNGVISVTVVANDAVTSDAVSTSVFLLGKDEGLRLFENYEGVKKIIVLTEKDI